MKFGRILQQLADGRSITPSRRSNALPSTCQAQTTQKQAQRQASVSSGTQTELSTIAEAGQRRVGQPRKPPLRIEHGSTAFVAYCPTNDGEIEDTP